MPVVYFGINEILAIRHNENKEGLNMWRIMLSGALLALMLIAGCGEGKDLYKAQS